MRFKGPGLRCAAALLPAALAAVAAAETAVVEADVARFDGNVLAEALILFGCVFILVHVVDNRDVGHRRAGNTRSTTAHDQARIERCF